MLIKYLLTCFQIESVVLSKINKKNFFKCIIYIDMYIYIYIYIFFFIRNKIFYFIDIINNINN